ncbi:pentapeptide repeat-containing protein [Halorussus ruber]|uniref:pentapeptide repeat-containing protein n=1 Tax=Halorussus ruber TaxID=1126238 RepID=UPI0010920E09|nr:pentapeptide repeat-containing protein [Halorussus ruber]
MSEEVPEDRCGYETDYESTSTSPTNICCCRPTWKGTNSCIWHANIVGKSGTALKKHRGQGFERLDGAILRKTEIKGLDLRDCIIVEADFSKSRLPNIDISDATIRKSDLSDCNLLRLKMQGGEIRYCDFSGSSLGEAEIRNSELFKIDFSNADFRMANISETNGEEVDFSNTWFKWADITHNIVFS